MSQDDSDCFDPLKAFNEMFSAGYHSKKLDAYLSMRQLIARRCGDDQAPIYDIHQIREGIHLWFRREVLRAYRHNDKLCELASLYYGMPVDADTPLEELAKLVDTFPGNDWGIRDVDKLADLFASVIGRSCRVIGQILVYDCFEYGKEIGDVAEMVRARGGSV